MSENEKPDGKRWLWPWIVVAMFAFYPVSLGPAAFVVGTGLLGDGGIPIFETIYAPLVMVAKPIPGAPDALQDCATACYEAGERSKVR